MRTRKAKPNERKRLSLIIAAGIICVLAIAFVFNIFLEDKPSPSDKVRYLCSPESRDADVCTKIYSPVCGLVHIQCVTTPCNPVFETFSNSCLACQNSLVEYYTEGEC